METTGDIWRHLEYILDSNFLLHFAARSAYQDGLLHFTANPSFSLEVSMCGLCASFQAPCENEARSALVWIDVQNI